jgi:hypothetical protein
VSVVSTKSGAIGATRSFWWTDDALPQNRHADDSAFPRGARKSPDGPPMRLEAVRYTPSLAIDLAARTGKGGWLGYPLPTTPALHERN